MVSEYALLRGLGRLDVFPGDDVGVRNNLTRRLGLAVPLDYAGVQQAVRDGRPSAVSRTSTCCSNASMELAGSEDAAPPGRQR